jgi:hypothetical protein
MRVRDQLIGALALAAVTYFALLRIAEAKCDAAVGSQGLPLDAIHPVELAAFRRLESQLERIGETSLAARLEELRLKEAIWVAPTLGPGRWAAYVESLGLVRRIYFRRLALLDPVAHLYPGGVLDVPAAFQNTFAWLSLAGAMRHELAHYDGALPESEAYRIELAWYEEIRRSAFVATREGRERDVWKWAIDSAIASAQVAATKAGAATP